MLVVRGGAAQLLDVRGDRVDVGVAQRVAVEGGHRADALPDLRADRERRQRLVDNWWTIADIARWSIRSTKRNHQHNGNSK